MKAILLISILALSSAVFASNEVVTCTSNTVQGRSLVLLIADQNVEKVVVKQSARSKTRSINVVLNANQEVEGVTQYSVLGSTSLLEVDNSVLEGLAGNVSLGNDTLSCL
jgi:hypothetical protein